MMKQSKSHYFRISCRFFIAALAMGFLINSVEFAKADQKKKTKPAKLPAFYSKWLDRDVGYIITRQERQQFLQLTTDDARDDFIRRFWDLRNPTPGSPNNSYKDEIYERIEYTDAHFAIGSGGEGWRTDRGRTYITMGKPQQIRTYFAAPNLRPIEVWFYSNLNPALPPFFYVLFYQPDNIGDFRYYSPYLDGPDKLVSGMEAINDPQSALKLIQSGAGPELARVAQSLIPGEPIDPNGRPSLQSDVMLAVLKNLPNQPSNIDDLNRRRALTDTVVSRMILDSQDLDIVLLPARDDRGLTRLSYAIRLGSPHDLTLTKSPQGNYSYSVEVRVRVYTADEKLIFAQEKKLSDKFDGDRLDEIKHRPFGYEGLLPLPPGKYHLDFLLTDWNQKVGYRADREVTIAESSSNSFSIPAVIAFSTAEPVDRSRESLVPFAMGGIRFRPLQGRTLFLNSTQNLEIAYQIWAPPTPPESYAGQDLTVQYALGQPAITGTPTVLKDAVDMSAFSSSGALVNGKKISLADRTDGNYMLTVSATGSGNSEKTYSSLAFQVRNDTPSLSPWDLDEPGIEADEGKGVLDEQRGLCYLAQGNSKEARLWFRLALKKNHDDDVARARLVDAYYSASAYSAVVSLLEDAGVTSRTDSATIVEMAESLLKLGNTDRAVSLLKDTIQARPDDGPLYLALADGYKQLGDVQAAAQMSEKGKSLLSSPSSDSKP